jgi:ABC-type phosphate transport system substrate-binding protein
MKDLHVNVVRLGAFLLAASAACGASAQGPKKKVAVIVNAANPVDSLRTSQIRELFLKKTQTWRTALADVSDRKGFDDGEPVRPVDLTSGHEERRVFLDKVLEMTGASLERHWVKVQYQNAVDPPTQAESSERAIRLVGSMRGGLGFVAEEALTEEARKKVKVVLSVTVD